VFVCVRVSVCVCVYVCVPARARVNVYTCDSCVYMCVCMFCVYMAIDALMNGKDFNVTRTTSILYVWE